MQAVRDFFDRLAPQWDEITQHDARRLTAVAALADIRPGMRVADIACGTGVLIPSLLSWEPALVAGIDLSPGMIEQARLKIKDERVMLTACDLFEYTKTGFDRAVVYSAYPHFPDKRRLAEHLTRMLVPGGRFVVAHSESRAVINGRHAGRGVSEVSDILRPALQEAAFFHSYFNVDTVVDTDAVYIFSGVRRA